MALSAVQAGRAGRRAADRSLEPKRRHLISRRCPPANSAFATGADESGEGLEESMRKPKARELRATKQNQLEIALKILENELLRSVAAYTRNVNQLLELARKKQVLGVARRRIG
jgi:hypothetical protein